ncbi:uncharacterized protein TNCV_3201771 [Trichonephila clavipes]|nr:uncharacterized protein TNCV_3201771 [Trichonephila clavipes]
MNSSNMLKESTKIVNGVQSRKSNIYYKCEKKLTVWCALWAGGILLQKRHNITVNGDRYRAMITNFFIPELSNHDIQELWFQQDGATCHTARATIDLLKDTFGDRLISRFGPVNWPPRFCDLTPLDYFLWGYVKSLVYADKPQTLDHLEDNIRRVIADIRPQMLEKVIENWTSRLDYIRASRGSPMPEIIFKMDQDKSWAPHVVCSVCVEELRQWFQLKKKSFRFAVPMIWREPQNHSDDCYFCSCSVQGFNLKNRKDISYPTIIRSAIRPLLHGPDLPIPSPPDTLDNILDQISHISSDSEDGYDPGTNDLELFSQSDLNDLVRDLGLPKDTAEVLGSRLKERQLLNSGVSFLCYRFREKEFVPFFTLEGDLVFCNNVPAILEMFKIMCEPEEWRLFIDSSKRSLKAVLLHNGNRYASVPVGHSVHLKECYENLDFILNKLSYSDHKCTICGDLKVISMLLGQQSGYTKFPCFLCEWDSRNRNNTT